MGSHPSGTLDPFCPMTEKRGKPCEGLAPRSLHQHANSPDDGRTASPWRWFSIVRVSARCRYVAPGLPKRGGEGMAQIAKMKLIHLYSSSVSIFHIRMAKVATCGKSLHDTPMMSRMRSCSWQASATRDSNRLMPSAFRSLAHRLIPVAILYRQQWLLQP